VGVGISENASANTVDLIHAAKKISPIEAVELVAIETAATMTCIHDIDLPGAVTDTKAAKATVGTLACDKANAAAIAISEWLTQSEFRTMANLTSPVISG